MLFQRSYIQIPSQFSIFSNRDNTRLLTDHQTNGVRAGRYSDGRTMARTQSGTIHSSRLGQRQLDPGRDDSVASDQNGHIVKGRARLKDGSEQLGGYSGVYSDTCLDELAQGDPLFNNDDRADSAGGKLHDRGHQFFHRSGYL